jgi:hypothetical protein
MNISTMFKKLVKYEKKLGQSGGSDIYKRKINYYLRKLKQSGINTSKIGGAQYYTKDGEYRIIEDDEPAPVQADGWNVSTKDAYDEATKTLLENLNKTIGKITENSSDVDRKIGLIDQYLEAILNKGGKDVDAEKAKIANLKAELKIARNSETMYFTQLSVLLKNIEKQVQTNTKEKLKSIGLKIFPMMPSDQQIGILQSFGFVDDDAKKIKEAEDKKKEKQPPNEKEAVGVASGVSGVASGVSGAASGEQPAESPK